MRSSVEPLQVFEVSIAPPVWGAQGGLKGCVMRMRPQAAVGSQGPGIAQKSAEARSQYEALGVQGVSLI